jgi:hypothetical protein
MPTAKGAWRVRYRLNGKRRSTAAYPSRAAAEATAAGLRDQYPNLPAMNADVTNSAPTVQGDAP